MVNLDALPCRKCGAIDRSKTDGKMPCMYKKENRKIYTKTIGKNALILTHYIQT